MKNLTYTYVNELIKPKKADAHKGDFGHALIIAGSIGKMGASIFSASACLRSGVGLLTVNIPKEERNILQIKIPEAMLTMRENFDFDLENFSAIGIGPGIGTLNLSRSILTSIITNCKKSILLDADALNLISVNKKLSQNIPVGTVITPHPREFDRLFGPHETNILRQEKAIKIAYDLRIIIVLKDHKTLITNGIDTYLNTNGNAGLAKGGSGDALCGMITSFMAQGYEPFEAAQIGVFIHGMAADLTLKKQSMESMLITDVIKNIGKSFKKISKKHHPKSNILSKSISQL